MDDERKPKRVPLDPERPDGLWVDTIRARDYLYPNAHREYMPVIEAYVDQRDIPELFRLLVRERLTPAEALARFDYLSAADRAFGLRTMLETFRRMDEKGLLEDYPHLRGL